jgi:hypothetical protein
MGDALRLLFFLALSLNRVGSRRANTRKALSEKGFTALDTQHTWPGRCPGSAYPERRHHCVHGLRLFVK